MILFGATKYFLKLYFIKNNGEVIYLQSSYEIRMADQLEKNNIKWIRPEPITWVDKNKEKHRYYADFYLIDFDVYLDTKNDYLIVKDKDKINNVRKQNKIKLLIIDKNNLLWENIKKLL